MSTVVEFWHMITGESQRRLRRDLLHCLEKHAEKKGDTERTQTIRAWRQQLEDTGELHIKTSPRGK